VEAGILTRGHRRFKRIGARRVAVAAVDGGIEVWAVLMDFCVDCLRLEAP